MYTRERALDNLKRVVQLIEQIPEDSINMSDWVSSRSAECGTVCCAAGWMAETGLLGMRLSDRSATSRYTPMAINDDGDEIDGYDAVCYTIFGVVSLPRPVRDSISPDVDLPIAITTSLFVPLGGVHSHYDLDPAVTKLRAGPGEPIPRKFHKAAFLLKAVQARKMINRLYDALSMYNVEKAFERIDQIQTVDEASVEAQAEYDTADVLSLDSIKLQVCPATKTAEVVWDGGVIATLTSTTIRQLAASFAFAADRLDGTDRRYQQLLSALDGDKITIDGVEFVVRQAIGTLGEIYLSNADPAAREKYQENPATCQYESIHVRRGRVGVERSAIWERQELIAALQSGNYVIC